jgi:phosphoribosylamine--glycine ligase
MSCFALTDGYDYVILPNAKDYKRIGEGDTGLNTGGMGAVSPVPFASEDLLKKIETTIITPTITGLQKDKIEFQGFLFFGLMIVNNKPFVIEYNVRLGDPETEVIIPRINSDLLELFNATANGCLSEFKLEINPKSAATVMLVSGGYPEAYQKGKEISGLDSVQDSLLFHAGTMKNNNKLVTNGGRVLAVTSYGDTVKEALKKSYKNTDNIIFDNKNFRKDIGFDL